VKSFFVRVALGLGAAAPGFGHAGFFVGYIQPGCFETVQQAVNAYCAYWNPDTTTNPDFVFTRDSCVLIAPGTVFVSAHVDDLSTGQSTPFFFSNAVQSCGDTIQPPKNNGPQCCVGNPINAATGNKYHQEVDYRHSAGALTIARDYNSADIVMPVFDFGRVWQGSYSKRITHTPNGSIGLLSAYRNAGRFHRFERIEGIWTPDPDVVDRITEIKNLAGVRVGWRYYEASSENTESYDANGILVAITSREGLTQSLAYSDGTGGGANGGVVLDASGNPTLKLLPPGLLIRVTDPYGRSLSYGYDAAKRIVKITDPGGGVYLYAYNANDALTKVTYPDGTFRSYLYENTTYPRALTGIVDENGERFSTYAYDAQGRAFSSEHAGGVARYEVSITNATESVVTDPLGTQRPRTFATTLGVRQTSGETQPGPSGSSSTSSAYDANGNVASYIDWNGNRTNYAHDLARNLETSRTEALTADGAATPQTRTISTHWHATFRLPVGVAEPLRITTFAYDPDGTHCGARGALCSKSIQATTDANGSAGFSATPSGMPRTWTYTYNANGNVLTIDGPRSDVTDVTTYTYYANDDADPGKRGNVATITNAAGHVTSVTAYNAHGQLLAIVDPNGLITTMSYDARQRLKTRTVGNELTRYDYDGVGQLIRVTLPDGSFLSYTYDAAHRLTGIEDSLGNRVAYTLDAMGNRTWEEVRDPSNHLAQRRSRVFNSLNRLFRELGAQNQTTEFAYDDQGNMLTVKDPLNRITASQYDALNRLEQVTSAVPISAVTHYAYNGLDAVVSVTDPRSLVTGYAVNGLGNLTQQASPDTGNTENGYDEAGNLVMQTDAKRQTTTFVYDALNRVTRIAFHDGSRQVYGYDEGTNGVGRLSSITERDAADQVTNVIAYVYDQHGRATSETRIVAGVQYVLAYRYDSSGRLDQLTYPSGRTIDYTFDDLGRVSGLTTAKPGHPPQTVVSGVAYHPFGGVQAYALGNGQVYSRGIDLDGRIASYSLGGQSFAIGYDAASRIEFISQVGNPPNSNTYGYDSLDRLTSAVLPGAAYGYAYDAAGNRAWRTAGSSTDVYAYSPSSNRIASITASGGSVRNFVFDANGSTTGDGHNTYLHDTRGRMVQATSSIGATRYQLNALGQRIRKTNTLADVVFHYDTAGRLIAETEASGALKRELIYLGDIPVGVVQ